MKKFKIILFQDSVYKVVDSKNFETQFQGSLCECESWIRLKEHGYL